MVHTSISIINHFHRAHNDSVSVLVTSGLNCDLKSDLSPQDGVSPPGQPGIDGDQPRVFFHLSPSVQREKVFGVPGSRLWRDKNHCALVSRRADILLSRRVVVPLDAVAPTHAFGVGLQNTTKQNLTLFYYSTYISQILPLLNSNGSLLVFFQWKCTHIPTMNVQ